MWHFLVYFFTADLLLTWYLQQTWQTHVKHLCSSSSSWCFITAFQRCYWFEFHLKLLKAVEHITTSHVFIWNGHIKPDVKAQRNKRHWFISIVTRVMLFIFQHYRSCLNAVSNIQHIERCCVLHLRALLHRSSMNGRIFSHHHQSLIYKWRYFIDFNHVNQQNKEQAEKRFNVCGL